MRNHIGATVPSSPCAWVSLKGANLCSMSVEVWLICFADVHSSIVGVVLMGLKTVV